MSDFEIWFFWGIKHILDLKGYDHILFVALLAISFPAKEWKRLLGLITAFTLGHSVTLALSVLNIIHIKREYCELLIALTILVTAGSLYFNNKNHPNRVMYLYAIICCFGLIHGMGFSFLLKSMMTPNESILKPLFYFNSGLEIGQIIIVGFVLLLSFLLTRYFKIEFRAVQKSFAIVAGLVSLSLCVQRVIDIYNS